MTDINRKISNRLFFFGTLVLAVSLPLSVYIMSISQFILAGAWLIEGRWLEKFKRAFSNKVVLALLSVYVLHLIGLSYSNNLDYGWKDMRIKLPLFTLPILFSTSPDFSKKQFYTVLLLFVSAVVVSTLISTGVLYDIIHVNKPIREIRDISIFISHIRLSLMICITIFICVYFLITEAKQISILNKCLLLIITAWLIIFLAILESITGLGILLFISIVYILKLIIESKKVFFKATLLTVTVFLFLFLFFYVSKIVGSVYATEQINESALDSLTPYGNSYFHDANNKAVENGHRIFIYISKKELDSAWSKRSFFPIDGKDERGQELRQTLIRFLTSKGLRKDANGVAALSASEIRSVEKGIANIDYQDLSSLKSRIHQVAWEISNYKGDVNPSGHSVVQRLEFWKAAIGIIRKNFIFGVGTGDIQDAFNRQYEDMKSPLDLEKRLRSHNQYLSITVALGVIGLLIFLLSLFYPYFYLKKYDFLYTTFLLVALLSMLTEDTLETQAGVTFFTFFNCFFLFKARANPDVHPKNQGIGA